MRRQAGREGRRWHPLGYTAVLDLKQQLGWSLGQQVTEKTPLPSRLEQTGLPPAAWPRRLAAWTAASDIPV